MPETFAPMVHRRHRTNVPPLARWASQAGTEIAYAQMAWPIMQDRGPGKHNPDSELVAH